MKTGTIIKITKKEFYGLGGFSNPNLFRKHNGKNWDYYKTVK
jgi:hypothetical protein